jgi:hypothetical protein
VSTVIIALIIYTMTIDKKKSIATLKLIGAPDRTIVGLIVQQALAMGVIGFVAGAALINLTSRLFPAPAGAGAGRCRGAVPHRAGGLSARQRAGRARRAQDRPGLGARGMSHER